MHTNQNAYLHVSSIDFPKVGSPTGHLRLLMPQHEDLIDGTTPRKARPAAPVPISMISAAISKEPLLLNDDPALQEGPEPAPEDVTRPIAIEC